MRTLFLDCGRFFFASDMNSDGVFTVSDIVAWFQFIYFLPAKIYSWFLYSIPDMRQFFEMDCSTGASWGGAIFSFFIWLIVFGALVPEKTK